MQLALRNRIISAIAVTAAASSASAVAAQPNPGKMRAAPFEAVLACRKLADDAGRLACYDQAAGRMDEAEAHGDIVVIDKAQAAAANRDAFGLLMPSLSVITKALSPDEADRVEGVVRTARVDPFGRWTMALEGGAVWRQIDGFLPRPPHAGSKVKIKRGMMASFLMNIDGQAAVKVHRDQ